MSDEIVTLDVEGGQENKAGFSLGSIFADLNLGVALQLYIQVKQAAQTISSGEPLPVGLSIPIGGKTFRIQGTLTEVK